MVSASVVLAVKIVTGLTSLLVILSPCVALARVVKAKDVGSVSALPLLLLLSSSHMWMMYGAIADLMFPVFSIFLFGEIAALSYLGIYWRFAGNQRPLVAKRAVVVVVVLSVLTVYALLGATGNTGQSHHGVVSTMGVLADIALVMLYGAPLERVAIVLRTKSAAVIQAPMVVAGTINNLSWFSYGLVTSNWFLIGPNCLFISLNVFQLALCFFYRQRSEEKTKVGSGNEVVTIVVDSSSVREIPLTPVEASNSFHALSSSALA